MRIGDDTDTVAAITGSLAGAWWGAPPFPSSGGACSTAGHLRALTLTD